MATAALIVSAFSMLAAVVAVVHAKRSADAALRSADAADRSAAAEERAATVAEHTLEIERERSASERRAREDAAAPRVDAGALSGNVWILEEHGSLLTGLIHNHGPGTALIERVEIHPQDGLEPVPANPDPDESAQLSPNDAMSVEIPWPHSRQPMNEPIILAVTFASSAPGYRATALFKLLRRGGDHVGQPLWSPGDPKITRL